MIDVTEATRPAGIARLARVELRKIIDTRAGSWVLAAVAVLIVALVALQLAFSAPSDLSARTPRALLVTAHLPVSVLLPALAVLSVTSEWSQRTALGTFALVPRRGRVVLAKAIAAVALASGGVVVTLVVTGVGFAVASATGRAHGGWEPALVAVVARLWLLAVVDVLFATAFGLLLLASAPAVVAFYVVPNAWNLLAVLVPGARAELEWLSMAHMAAVLVAPEVTGREWAQVLTAGTVWVILPAAVGWLRVRRADLS